MYAMENSFLKNSKETQNYKDHKKNWKTYYTKGYEGVQLFASHDHWDLLEKPFNKKLRKIDVAIQKGEINSMGKYFHCIRSAFNN